VVDGPGSDDQNVDEIDAGGPLLPSRLASALRTPRGRWLTRGATVCAALVVAVAVSDTVATRLAVTDGIPRAAPLPAGATSPFERVLALVGEPHLTGNIRQASEPGGCTPVAPGHSPERAVLTVLRQQVLSDPSAIDTARTLDQFTGLCSLELRASAPGGVRLVVLISAPPGRPGLFTLDAVEVGLENTGAVSVEYVAEAMHTGWQILIGAVGPPADLPRTADLTRAAGEPQLQW
jgi:hypothetical protein